jgi:hypothetical protein
LSSQIERATALVSSLRDSRQRNGPAADESWNSPPAGIDHVDSDARAGAPRR